MSSVSDIYDAYITFIEANLSSYSRIPDPYDPDKNASLFLNKGYGLGFGPATNTNRELKPRMSFGRQFFVILVNRITASELSGSSRGTQEKLLLEDSFTLIKAIESDDTFGGAGTQLTKYLSDTGIDFFGGKKAKYYSIEISFETEYFELTS